MFAGRRHIAIRIYFGRLGMYLYPGIENIGSTTVFAGFCYAIEEQDDVGGKGVRRRFPARKSLYEKNLESSGQVR